jgi:hypothetical protein
MSDPVKAIATIRDGVCAILRVQAKTTPGQFTAGISGTAWCVSSTGGFVTAYHVFNNGKPRNPSDKFYLVRAPGNGTSVQFWPVTAFVVEDSNHDLAVITAPTGLSPALSTIPVTLTPPPDGATVLTFGCPAAAVVSWAASPTGDVTGLNTALFTHANTGILSAQFRASATIPETVFEFSVRWYEGESGGPVLRLEPSVAAFAVMQSYRIIDAQHGKVDGPRRGFGLAGIQTALKTVGATFV